MKQKTPQEKKALSYEKDCRNTYGENDKSSRKNIPLSKAKAKRSTRKKMNDILQRVEKQIDIEVVELIENEVLSVKRNQWKKYPDKPLGQVIEGKFERRELHAGNGKTARKKVREFVKNIKIETEQENDGRWIAEATELNGVIVYGETREEAIEKCKQLAGYGFLENLGAIKILRIDDDSTSILTY